MVKLHSFLKIKNVSHARTFLVLALMAVCSAFAGEPTYENDVYPLTFGTGYANDKLLEMWNRLMKYKLFATGETDGNGISFLGSNIYITDSVGYVGSAKGNFVMGGNSYHSIGGPLMFGGSFINETGYDSILTGPTRFTGSFNPSNIGASSNYFAGKYCAAGYNTYATQGLRNGASINGSYCDNTDEVYAVDVDLDVPVLQDASVYWNDTINSGVRYIHVPPACDGITYTSPNCVGDTGTAYNYFVKSISFSNGSKLHVVMPPNGRLTKVFVQGSITGLGVTGGNNIQVVYAKGATWNDSAWVGFEDTPLTNSEYAGNLLIYTPNDLTLGAGEKYMQGTYISGGTIHFAQNTNFAGQLLAKFIEIDANISAQDFKYVPFNPTQIGISLASNQAISEDDPGKAEYQDGSGSYIGTRLQVELTKKPDTDVKFDYCFQFKGTVNSGSNLANYSDIDTSKTHMPICGISTKTAIIPKDSIRTKDPIRVWIVDDNIEESPEFFQLVASNLVGGVFSDNSREWPIQFRILDNDHSTPCNVISGNNSVTIPEDASIALTNGTFPAFCSDSTALTHNVIIDSIPMGGTLKLNGSTVARGTSIPSSQLASLIYTPNANRNGTAYDFIKFKINDPVESRTTSRYTLTINVTPVNDAPTAEACNKTLIENVSKGTSVCQVKGHDVDSLTKAAGEKYTLSYSITYGNKRDENGNLPFSINSSNGKITVNGTLNYERINYYPLIVRVTDGSAYVDVPVNVTITDVNEKPNVTGFETTVVENGGIEQYIGRIDAYDPEDGRKYLTYSIISGDTAGVFEIRKVVVQGDTVALVYTKKNIDYESLSNQDYKYILKVTVTDKQGAKDTVQATIYVTNENEAPIVKNDTCEIVENARTWTKGCSVVAIDPEGRAMTYTIAVGNGSSLFSINASGAISVTSAPNYEEGSLYLLGIDVSDGVNTSRAWVLMRVLDVNEPPTAIVRNGTVEENSTSGTPVDCVVGGVLYHCVEGFDEDAGTALTYSIVGGDTAGVFTINSAGDILVAKDHAIDYEKQSSYDLTIRICDNGKPGTTPSCIEQPSTVTVIDGDEMPTATGFTVTIRENAPVDSVVGTVRASDPEGDNLTFSFGSGNNGKAFSIDSETGKVKVAREIDFEALTKKTFEIQVFVNDGHNRIETLVEITITDINEGPEIDDATMTVAENQPKGTTVGSMMGYVYDPDSPVDFLKNTFTAVGGDKAKFTIDANTGVIKTNDAFDYEAQKTYTLLVQVRDSDGNADTATVIIDVTDVTETSEIVVTHIESGNGGGKIDYPDLSGVYYTNEKAVAIQWTVDGIAMPDTLVTNLKEGANVVTLAYGSTTEAVGIFVSTRTPEVTMTIADEYSEVSSGYVGIAVNVKTPRLDMSYSEEGCNYDVASFVVTARLNPVEVPDDVYDVVNKVVRSAPVLNEMPSSDVTYSQYNTDMVKVSYTEKVAGVDVEVSYLRDGNGNLGKVGVLNSRGKVDSMEVMTVSYLVNVNGKSVAVSYQADAITGEPLRNIAGSKGSDSRLSLTEGEVQYKVTYDNAVRVGSHTTTLQVGYAVDKKGNVVVNDGNVGYEVSYTYVNEMGNSSTQSVFIAVDQEPAEMALPKSWSQALKMTVSGRNVHLSGVTGSKPYEVLDLQGRIIRRGIVSAIGTVIPIPHAGTYLVRVDGVIHRILVK